MHSHRVCVLVLASCLPPHPSQSSYPTLTPQPHTLHCIDDLSTPLLPLLCPPSSVLRPSLTTPVPASTSVPAQLLHTVSSHPLTQTHPDQRIRLPSLRPITRTHSGSSPPGVPSLPLPRVQSSSLDAHSHSPNPLHSLDARPHPTLHSVVQAASTSTYIDDTYTPRLLFKHSS